MKIYFFLLAAKQLKEWQYNACLLAEQAYQQGSSVYFLTESSAHAKQLDALLWTYCDDICLPHQCYDPNTDPLLPIQIGYDMSAYPQTEILVNMSPSVPVFYLAFKRVIELIPEDKRRKQQGREKYRYYQHEGCEVVTQRVEGQQFLL